jgi:class 3 adenylate cyclase/tetratricopeptide (TPR) repeat protein
VPCATCGTQNEAGRKFCLNCGTRLAVSCPSCGTANTPGARFCGECGTAIAEGATTSVSAAPVAAAPSTERRLVSVLFADLVGFTTLSEARDAEDVRELLSAYFDSSRATIERYGGSVEKFIGDAVMAVWGTPTAQEDDAERAVRAGLELVDAVRRLGSERQMPELALRAAVMTGEAVVTIGASGMGMVAGDLVNTASRLQSAADPGSVLVGEGTQRAAHTAIVFEPAGDRDMKGKTVPVTAFRAVRVVAQRGGVGRSEGLEAPFVGRDAELQLIKDFYHATAREPAPRLVSVIGQPGIGKSRLAWEFLKYIDGVTEIVHWHQGRSPAYGEGISFWALGEMVRMRIGSADGDDEAATRERVTTALEEFVTDADERRSMTEPLLQLLGLGGAAVPDRPQLFKAWRTFFERVADVAPVVMVFEDLQWADAGMLDFVEDLVTWSRGHSIYIITLARPELLDVRPTWGAGQRAFTSLSLSPLDDDAMRTILHGLVPGLPDDAVSQIVASAAGVPLYAVETVRTLLNEGRIERDGETFRPVGELSDLSVPESLHALIAARIDALPAAERTLVQDASVLGLSFTAAALEAVARSPSSDLESMLRHLVQREIFTVDDDPRSPERGQHRFVQSLVREVAYGTLSRDDRRARHLAAARYFETLGDDELSGVLAQHYVEAYRAHPDGPEGAAVAAQARVALRGAAQRAADLGSFRLAHSSLTSMLELLDDPGEEQEVEALARNAAANAGLTEAAIAHGERAVVLATELGLTAERRRATALLGNVLIEGFQDRAIKLLAEAMAEPGLTPEDDGYLELATVLAKAEMRRTNDRRAVELADSALAVAGSSARDDLVLDLVITRAVALSNMGRSTEAVTVLTGAWEIARRRELRDAYNRAAVNLSYAIQPDDPLASFEVARDALDQSLRDGVVWGIRYILGNAVDGAIEVGEWDWAITMIDEHGRFMAEPAEDLWFGVFRTVIEAYRGEDVEADARRLAEFGRTIDDQQFQVVGSQALMADHLVHRRHAELVALVRWAQELGPTGQDATVHGVRSAIWDGDLDGARTIRSRYEVAWRGRRTRGMELTMDAGIAMLEGRSADARLLYAEALRMWRELGCTLWRAMVGLDVAMTDAMEPAERSAVVAETREIFTRLRATALLDLLDAAVATEPDRAPATTSRAVPQEA